MTPTPNPCREVAFPGGSLRFTGDISPEEEARIVGALRSGRTGHLMVLSGDGPRFERRARLGETVHYSAMGSADGTYPSVCRAAIVTQAPKPGDADTTVGLCVLNPTGIFLNPAVRHHPGDPADGAPGARCELGDRAYPGGTWHFPEGGPL